MKHGIFISYSDFDKDKVGLIVQELEHNTLLYPIVIASNREALKPLAQKVADGIIEAKVIVPIITKNSINTQWINQEIGFATALQKKIMPVVQAELIETLKGFIHKQIDLPYNFLGNNNRGIENKNFIKHVRTLFADVELEYQSLTITEPLKEKTDFEKSLEKIEKANEELEFQSLKDTFLNSSEAVDFARTEVLDMFNELEEKMKKLQEKKFFIGFEKEVYNPTFILKCEGFSFSIAWQQKYSNTNLGALLYVRKWRGQLTKDPNAFAFPDEKPQLIQDDKYTFDRDRENKYCWLHQTDNKQYRSTQIVDSCIKWLVDKVTKAKLTGKGGS
jgi:hypothetical protein